MKNLEGALRIANIHANRLQSAIEHMQSYFPISSARLENLSYEDMTTLELYTNRFAKLQDHLGQNVFPIILEMLEEPVETMAFKDKLNRLEKLHILESAQAWREAREIRNHISHEYPDNLELMATNLNRSYETRFVLLDCLKNLNETANKLDKQQ